MVKITKKYLQKVINEEIKRILNEDHHHATAPGEGPQKKFRPGDDITVHKGELEDSPTRGMAGDESGDDSGIELSDEELRSVTQGAWALAKTNKKEIMLIKERLGMQ